MSRLEHRLRIDPDGTITAYSGKVELGQGIRTAFARLVAGALQVPFAVIRIELGDTATTPWDMGTFGSLSVRSDGALLARAAGFARRSLIERAARRWGVAAGTLTVERGAVVAGDGRRVSYGELVDGEPLVGEIPDDLAIAPAITGGDVGSRERWAIVTGTARFAADLRVPELLYGRVLHPPSQGARLVALDDTEARAVPGVVAVVRDADFVGAVAQRPAQASAALQALVPEWAAATVAGGPERRLVLRDDARVAKAIARAATVLDATYALPHVANAPIGTTTAIADVHDAAAVIHATTQRPFGLRDDIARLLGVAPAQVRVIAAPAAGSFGRNNSCESAIEAVRLSRAVGRPVLVEWSRADELGSAPHRPRLSAHVKAGLDASGRLVGWSSEIATNPHVYFGDLARLPDEIVAMTCARNAMPAYRIEAAHIAVQIALAEIRTAALRSLSAAPNVFAIESAIDELAILAAIDPLELRLRNTEDPRLRRVLACVAERSDWARRPRGDGIGRGLACAIYNDTYVAQVAEVAVVAGRPRVRRAWCALDCGTLVDPDGARNQVEGAIVHATSWALVEELRQDRGRVLARSWDDYPIARFHDAPDAIDVAFTDDGETAPTGVGEAGAVPFGAAIANAVVAASGVRVRTQPIRTLG